MDELRKEQLQKLEAKTRELHAQMKTKFDTRMENLSALVSKLPEGHPYLLNFRRDWEMEGAADEAELKQINHNHLVQQSAIIQQRGPSYSSTLYGHIRQAHPDALQEANSSGEPMHFSAFQGDYMALHCVDRWLATKEFEKLIKATRSGVRYSTLARKPVKVVVGDHDTKFPTLCLKHFSSVVLRDDLKWVDLRCPYCNTNKLSGYKKYRQGIKGFMLHMTKIHGFNPPDSGSSWKWLLDQCTQWSSHPEVDVRDLESGLHIIPVVPPADEKSDTLLVKLKVSSLFYENANERESVHRMQAILPTEPKAKLLTALRANKSIPDARAQAQRSYTPPTPPGFIMGTKAESEPRITIRTVCPCSVSGHKCKLEMTCGRTVVCSKSNCNVQSCQDYHGIKSTCQACLKFDVDLHELTEHQKDCPYGHDQMKVRLAIADDHLCYRH